MALFNSKITAAAAAAPSVIAPQFTVVTGHDRANQNALSRALTTTDVVTPPHMVRPYMAHQGAAHIAARSAIASFGCALLGDDMGMGKTQVLLGLAAEILDGNGYAIGIIPPVAVAGYRGDLQAAFPSMRMAVIGGRKPDFANLPVADLYLISDDSLTLKAWLTTTTVEHRGGKEVKVLHASAFAKGAGFLFRDEIHRDKGANGKPSTATSRAAVMLAVGRDLRAGGTPIVAATGTLLTNKVVEAFIPLQVISGGADVLKAVTPGTNQASGFLWRYCNPQKVWTGRGYATTFGSDFDRLPELHENLRSTVYVRREKSDLGDALPNSGWLIKPLALNGVLRRYEAIERDVLAVVREEGGPAAYMRAAKAERLVQIMKMWEEAGRAKCAAAVEYIEDLVDQGRKVVAFFHHSPVRDGLMTGLAKANIRCTVIDGKVTGAAREDAIHSFQNGADQVMLAQMGAAGMAVTLTAAADAVFVQVPWSAGVLKQCADRILRVDDRTMARAKAGEQITWHVLQAAHADGAPTIDGAIFQVLEAKSHICDAINAGKPVTLHDENIVAEALAAWFPQASQHYGA